APALGQRAFVAGAEGARVKDRHAAGVWINRTHQMAGNVLRLRRSVALQAIVCLALENRLLRLLLAERVKHRTLLRIGCGHFHHFAMLAKADIGVVVEVDGPWRAARDLTPLK